MPSRALSLRDFILLATASQLMASSILVRKTKCTAVDCKPTIDMKLPGVQGKRAATLTALYSTVNPILIEDHLHFLFLVLHPPLLSVGESEPQICLPIYMIVFFNTISAPVPL